MAALTKPPSVASDPFKSAKWDELARGRSLRASDAPALELLVQWYAVVQRCIDDMDEAGGQVAYSNKLDDIRALPQIAIMKQASAEIRQLSRQLGVDGEAEGADSRRSAGCRRSRREASGGGKGRTIACELTQGDAPAYGAPDSESNGEGDS